MSTASLRHFVAVEIDDNGLFRVSDNIDASHEGLTQGDVATFLMEAIVRCLSIFRCRVLASLLADARRGRRSIRGSAASAARKGTWYIHEKFRRNGGRTLCLPFLRWVHRVKRPMGLPYRNKWEERIRNYMIGFMEFGLPTADLEQHFHELLAEAIAKPIIDIIKAELDRIPMNRDGVPDDVSTSGSAPS